MIIKEYIKKATHGEDLTRKEARDAMDNIMCGEATPAQVAGLIIGLKMKGERAEEVAGFVESMRRHANSITLNDKNAVDGCGTGGDGSHSFNISTAASLVAASAGVTVAKHGNRSVSSKCGSADLLEATGGRIDADPDHCRQIINDVGFGFLFAPKFHPAMRHAVTPRRELGVRTIFNILGPMTNPAGVKRQVIGVYSRDLLPLMADVLQATGSEHVIVAHSRDGFDEFSISAPTDYIEVTAKSRSDKTLDITDIGLETHPADELAGDDAEVNLAILRQLLDGHKNGVRSAVALNAGVMIYVAGKAESIRDGVQSALAAINSGAARTLLQQWVDRSRASAL